jgi:sugar lactone lactonase YvrE
MKVHEIGMPRALAKGMRMARLPALLVLWTLSAVGQIALGQTYTIQTIAGGGWDIPGISANLSHLSGVAIDGAGNVFMALSGYSVVVRMDSGGQLSLVAGNGTQGYSGDDGPATLAQLGSPTAVAVDAAGNVYIVDNGNNRIRKVSNGVISTVAGGGSDYPGDNGPATSAGLQLGAGYGPGLAVDSAGSIYFADAIRIRKVSNGVITTVAGGGFTFGDNVPATSVFVNPAGIAVDASGRLYFADRCDNRIHKVSNGIITTVAGNGTANAFLCAPSVAGGDGTATSVSLNGPSGVTVDTDGNVYFMEGALSGAGAPSRARKVSNGTITTVAGGFSGPPFGPPVSDNIPATSALLGFASGIAVDTAGNLYISDEYWVAFPNGPGSSPELGRLRKVSNGVITTIAGANGDSGPAIGAQLNLPAGVALDSAGNLYIADSSNHIIREVSNGAIATIAGSRIFAVGSRSDSVPALSGDLAAPQGIVVGPAGHLYIADGIVFDLYQGVITPVASPADLGWFTSVALDATGNLYVANWTGNQIQKVSNGLITTIAGDGTFGFSGDNGPATSAQLAGPSSIALDGAGNIYFSDTLSQRIRKVSNGVITTVAGNGTLGYSGDGGPAASAQFLLQPPGCLGGICGLNRIPALPTGIAVDSFGNLYIVDSGNQRVRKVSNGVITTVAGNGTRGYSGDGGPAASAQLNNPSGIAVDAAGKIYVSDSSNGRIRVLTPPVCAFGVSPSSIQSVSSGGTFHITVQTGGSCVWTASGLPAWITGAIPLSITGPGTITLVIAANSGASRSATILVAGISVTINQATCTYAISPGGQVFTTAGGTGLVTVTAPAGCGWSATNSIPFVSFNGAETGSGNGALSFLVSANVGGGRSGTFAVAGLSFTVEQQSATLRGLNFIGSMPHVAAEENWTTTFTLVNKGAASATARLSLFGDPSGTLTLPLAFPQAPAASGPELAASLDRTLSANASLIIDTAGLQTPPVQIGSAQLAATGAVDGFAIFHLIPGAQEAVVPMETRNASSYLLAFDNTSGVVLGVAVENVSAQAGSVGIVLRDDAGTQIGTGSISMSGNGHTSFVLSTQYPVTANKRGTIEFDAPAGGPISVLGIRTTPVGTINKLTTIPALANVGTNGGSIAHIATGNGWQTTFVLVNAGTSPAQVNLNFFADVTGAPLSMPISFPQVGSAVSAASSVNQTLAAGATLLVQSAAPSSNPAPTIGSAQLTTTGNVSGFAIFRYNPNGQEAAMALESRNANAYILAFDNTNGTATGIAINSLSSQAVNVPVIVRDDAGTQIATDTLNVDANGHLSFTLVVDKYAATANIRGTIEFDTPPGGQIGALGIRIPVAHTFTTLPALAK